MQTPSSAPSASEQALNARWRAFQLRLADQLKELSSPTAIVETATGLLAGYLGASHCWYTEVGKDDTFFSRAGWFDKGIAPMPTSGRIADFGPAVIATLGMGKDFVVDDVAADARTSAFAASYGTLMIGALLAVPIFKNGRWLANLNVARREACGWSSDDILVTRDVAERTWSAVENALAQADLRKERDRSQYIFDTLSEGLVLLAADDTLAYANDAALRFCTTPREALAGKPFPAAFPALDGAGLRAMFGRVRASSRAEAAEYPCILPNGGQAWLDIRANPSLEDGLAVFFNDISGRKLAVLAAQKAAAHKSMLLDLDERLRSVADDPSAMMTAATRELARILDVPRVGYVSMDESVEYGTVGHNYNDTRRVPELPPRRERLDDYGLALAADIRAGRVMRVTDLATDPRTAGPAAQAHAEIGARASVAAPIQRAGKTVAFMFAHHDQPREWSDDDVELMRATAARTWDAVARARAVLALRETDRRKDEFLAMLAHELRNPLAPISSAADLLRLGRLDEARVRQTSGIISRQVRHMTGLIDDLLDVSRVTRGLVSLDRREVDVRSVVGEAVEQVKPLIELRCHQLDIQVAPGPAHVWGDQKRLVQCVANVLNNAAKYTPEGGSIVLRLHAEDGQAVITVADNGIGMRPEVVAHAFELFAQAERTSDRAQGGLGIGLALVKSLVELHGGQVTLCSGGLGHGSEFVIRLPRFEAVSLAPTVLPAQVDGPAAAAATRQTQVMIVDDNIDAAEVLGALCELLGYAVTIEHSSQRALERAMQEGPEVCLIDIGLPDMDGNELASRLRRLPGTAQSMLVAVTGYGQDKDRAAAQASGFDHYLVKPVDAETIWELLQAR
ncbi:ATP-binding protein [Massilia sp. IC2-476]|uniref:ATP-binding protein n=1 Tax=Massilia sp. IC2-476 TaxID=2887199 RepID=UPI001D0F8C02|nr:ATP-binding protein [Massilia sp. IC2-476]MCC2970709.1 response regulator [Massilia sp. IC2-476]